jgi:hypothetical protein
LKYLAVNRFSFDWSFRNSITESRRLPTQLDTLKMPMEEVTESNYLCEQLVSASATTLRHLRLDPDDARPESYVRMFTSVSETLAMLDCRRPGGPWSAVAGGLRILTALKELIISVDAFVEQPMILSLAAMTSRAQLECLTLGPEEWPDTLMMKKPPGDRTGYGSLLLLLAKTVSTKRIRMKKVDWKEYSDRATKHSPAAVRALVQFEGELEKRGIGLEFV